MLARSLLAPRHLLRTLHTRSMATLDLKSKALIYNTQGFAVFPQALSEENAESLRHSASLLMKGLAEQPKNATLPASLNKNKVQDVYLYFSGGRKVNTEVKEVKLTANVRGITGEGISVLANGLHNGVEAFEDVAYSRMVKRISRDIFGMKAPLIASSLYISSLGKAWSTLRKDNSFIRTNPLSTQSIVIALSDTNKDEGFFAVKGSHSEFPASFLRKVYCDIPEGGSSKAKPTKALNQKCEMLPQPKDFLELTEAQGECVPLKKGDVLAYHGNLSYYLNCTTVGNNLLFLHLVEGRGVKWEHDNV